MDNHHLFVLIVTLHIGGIICYRELPGVIVIIFTHSVLMFDLLTGMGLLCLSVIAF